MAFRVLLTTRFTLITTGVVVGVGVNLFSVVFVLLLAAAYLVRLGGSRRAG